jgi:Protein of unknown function (DUF1573)
MKKLGYLILLVAALVSCQDRKNDKNGNINMGDYKPPTETVIKDSTTVQLIDSVYDFGTIKEGEKTEFSFRFKNTGKNPLVIINATASCGCTVPEKPEQPIKPGEIGFIKAVFNSKGKVGPNNKSITVTSNVLPPGFPVLTLKGEVLASKE